MLESLLTTLDHFTPEILVILSGLLVITTTLFLWLWFANRRAYNLLKHQLPASVVKNYLDSIIQNSTALKSSLMRGGSPELGAGIPVGIPAVMPPSVLGGAAGAETSVTVASGNDAGLREELQQRLAEIAALQAQLTNANKMKADVETSLTTAQARIKELEAMLAKGGGDEALANELRNVSKERDQLRDKLKEYEIIEDDLANLKRLQQENLQLRKALEAKGVPLPNFETPMPLGSAPAPAPQAAAPVEDPLAAAADLFDEVSPAAAEAAPVEAPVAETPAAPAELPEDATAELEKFLGDTTPPEGLAPEAPDALAAAAPDAPEAAAAPDAPKAEGGSEKTPEDLLSEFEKMLG